MTTISAGGGSIAAIDGGGFLTVGPQSAGADPGPACYGRGGGEPTVTDADLVCGFLNADYFLGGKQKLDAAASHTALESHIAKPLKMSVLDAAAGIRRIVDMRMADEVRLPTFLRELLCRLSVVRSFIRAKDHKTGAVWDSDTFVNEWDGSLVAPLLAGLKPADLRVVADTAMMEDVRRAAQRSLEGHKPTLAFTP